MSYLTYGTRCRCCSSLLHGGKAVATKRRRSITGQPATRPVRQPLQIVAFALVGSCTKYIEYLGEDARKRLFFASSGGPLQGSTRLPTSILGNGHHAPSCHTHMATGRWFHLTTSQCGDGAVEAAPATSGQPSPQHRSLPMQTPAYQPFSASYEFLDKEPRHLNGNEGLRSFRRCLPTAF